MTALDVIVPVAPDADPAELDRRLFSLALQDHTPTTVHLRGGAIDAQAAPVFSLTAGISLARPGVPPARYLAILPADATIGPAGYVALLAEMVRSGAAVAVGGIAEKVTTRLRHADHTTTRRLAALPSPALLAQLGCYPVHAALFDRTQVDTASLCLEPDTDRLLPRICARFPASFALAGTVVGDRYVRSRPGSRTW